MLVNAYFNSEGEMCPRCRFRGTSQKILKLLTLVSIDLSFGKFHQPASGMFKPQAFPNPCRLTDVTPYSLSWARMVGVWRNVHKKNEFEKHLLPGVRCWEVISRAIWASTSSLRESFFHARNISMQLSLISRHWESSTLTLPHTDIQKRKVVPKVKDII